MISMTSKTGKTEATLKGTVAPPTIVQALSGAVIQLAAVGYVWCQYTSLGDCVASLSRISCMEEPWSRQVAITLGMCLTLWLYSLRTIPYTGTSDPSIVDRLWSIVPALYCWHFFAAAQTARGLVMAVLSTVWGARLTYNFAMKGGFSGGEDYRWAEIRTWPGFARGWELFNLVFICLFQQVAILAFTSPAAAAMRSSEPLNALDAVAALLYCALVGGEAAADRQMYVYQTEKYRRRATGEPLGAEYARGFVESGLWAYSRHPNYFCEVSLWWAFYLFSIASGMPLLNWTALGPVFLTCLFVLPQASLDVTETLSSRKYPEYAAYQARVSRFVPLPPLTAKEARVPRPPLPWVDRLWMGWFVVGLAIAFLIDFEQALVPDPYAYGRDASATPLWPPDPCVRAIHWWGRCVHRWPRHSTADALLLPAPSPSPSPAPSPSARPRLRLCLRLRRHRHSCPRRHPSPRRQVRG